MDTQIGNPLSIEGHSIDYIPEDERHGRVRDLASFWFGPNMIYSLFAAGFLMVATGFPFLWSVIGITIGAVLGTFVAAFHAAQGPKLGLPQMIQSRAQFGYVGAVLPMLVAEVAYVVFFAACPSLGAIVANVFFGLNIHLMVVLLTLAMALIALFGYDLSHVVGKWLAALSIVFFAALTIVLIAHPHIPHASVVHWTAGHFNLGIFLGVVSLCFVFLAGYGPYVADYARYLPRKSSMWGTGIATSIGLGASALWMFYLGAYLSSIGNFSSGTTNLLLSVTNGVGHWFSDVTGVVILAVLVLGGSVNLYAGVNTGLGIEASFRPGEATPRNSRKARIAALVPITAICLWASFLYAGNFYVDFNDALAVLLILLVPWSAINLTDFYYIRRGHYRLEDMFNRRGPYGLIGWSGMIAFVASFVIELPFANLGFWDGPLSKRWFDGGDFSWVVGLIVGAVVYAGLAWKIRVSVSDTDRLRHAQVHVTDSPSTLEMVPEAELYGSE